MMTKNQRNGFVIFVTLLVIIVGYLINSEANQIIVDNAFSIKQVKIKNSTYFKGHKSYNQESLDDEIPLNYKSVELNSKVELSGSFFQKTDVPWRTFVEKSCQQNNSNTLDPAFGTSMNLYNTERSDQFSDMQTYSFNLRGEKVVRFASTSQQHGFYSTHSDINSMSIYSPAYNNSGKRSVIGGPGDQPNTNPIPIPDGAFTLLFMVAVYAGWKMRVLKN